jgi:hypothetical protein
MPGRVVRRARPFRRGWIYRSKLPEIEEEKLVLIVSAELTSCTLSSWL